MKSFNLQNHIDTVYGSYPAARCKPVIGITGNYEDFTCKLGKGYYQSVIRAGGVPLVIPPSSDTAVLMNTLDHIDALILSGGGDINPLYCGEEPVPQLHGINSERDLPELLITRLAYNRQMPILGICRGIQTLAVALGGKVCQDISSTPAHIGRGGLVKHSQDADRSEPTHSVTISEGSTLFNIYKDEQQRSTLNAQRSTVYVNSFHHQAVSETGERFRVVATATDGIVEAIESSEFKSILGVQWHPECLGDDGLIKTIAHSSMENAKQACLYAMMKYNRLVWDFMVTVIGEKYRNRDMSFGRRDLNVYFIRLQEQIDSVAAWSDTTVAKAKQVLLRVLVENEYLDAIDADHLNPVWLDSQLENAIRANHDEAMLPAFNCLE